MQPYTRQFILNQQLAHLNELNFENLGEFWAAKMRKTKLSVAESGLVLKEVKKAGIDEQYLRGQWRRQFDAVTTHAPGEASIVCSAHKKGI